MLRIPKIIYNNKFNLPSLPPPGSFKDQTILITGGNSGLGLATAVHFINLGASTVIITTRHATKGEAAKASTEAQTNTTGKVKVMELDMSTFASVKDFADRVKQEVKSIDYVLLNAGLLNNAGRVSPDGFEETLQVWPIPRFNPSLLCL
jgi:NAD(P)-dependent dehydrogenase (short-subunit alcohol dehydrogenase family)